MPMPQMGLVHFVFLPFRDFSLHIDSFHEALSPQVYDTVNNVERVELAVPSTATKFSVSVRGSHVVSTGEF